MHFETMPFCLYLRVNLFYCLGHQFIHIQNLGRQLDESTRDPRYVKQVVNKLCHMRDLPGDNLGGPLDAVAIQAGNLEQLGRRADGCQRVTQLVCKHC